MEEETIRSVETTRLNVSSQGTFSRKHSLRHFFVCCPIQRTNKFVRIGTTPTTDHRPFSFVYSIFPSLTLGKHVTSALLHLTMSMYLPYGTMPATGQTFYGPPICTNMGYPFNPYQPPFYPRSNGLLPNPTQGFIQSRPSIATPIDKNPTSNVRSVQSMPTSCPLSSLRSLMAQKKNERKVESIRFSTFLQEENKSSSELNPFASEFSLGKSDLEVSQPAGQSAPTSKIILNDLVEQSLQSIEKASKSVSPDAGSPILVHRF